MGHSNKNDDTENVIAFKLPQFRELDEELEGDIHALIIFASRLRDKRRRKLLVETAHRFLTLEIASDSQNYQKELAEAIVAPKLFSLYKEIGGLSFQRAIEAALDEDAKALLQED